VNPRDLAAAPCVEDGVLFCGTSLDDLWALERARAKEVAASEKTSLQWAQKRDDRDYWARTALLEGDMGAASPFTYFDETIGALRSVRVAIILPGDSTLEKLMNDEKYSDRVDKLYQAGALVALKKHEEPFDLLLVSLDVDLKSGKLPKVEGGLARLQEQGRVVLWEPFVNQALETSTAVLGEDEASVALRKKHAIFWRTPCGPRYAGKDPDVVDDIPRVQLGSANSFRVHPEVLEASNKRAAARQEARRLGRRRR